MRRIALVTGASRGIGAAAAHAFARAGYAVVLAARDAAALEAVAGGIRASGGDALAVPTDVADEAAVARLAERARDSYGGIDVAFNNAGGGAPRSAVADLDVAAFSEALQANVVGTFLCVRAEVAAMRVRGGGAIVNMSSTAGLQGVAGLAGYCAAKHAVIGLTKAAALDHAGEGIRINAVAPGPIVTERIPADAVAQIARAVPLARVGAPEEVADLVTWLCSDRAAFITGAVVPIDGGRLAGVAPFARSA